MKVHTGMLACEQALLINEHGRTYNWLIVQGGKNFQHYEFCIWILHFFIRNDQNLK